MRVAVLRGLLLLQGFDGRACVLDTQIFQGAAVALIHPLGELALIAGLIPDGKQHLDLLLAGLAAAAAVRLLLGLLVVMVVTVEMVACWLVMVALVEVDRHLGHQGRLSHSPVEVLAVLVTASTTTATSLGLPLARATAP